jgi:hypothetical protein
VKRSQSSLNLMAIGSNSVASLCDPRWFATRVLFFSGTIVGQKWGEQMANHDPKPPYGESPQKPETKQTIIHAAGTAARANERDHRFCDAEGAVPKKSQYVH